MNGYKKVKFIKLVFTAELGMECACPIRVLAMLRRLGDGVCLSYTRTAMLRRLDDGVCLSYTRTAMLRRVNNVVVIVKCEDSCVTLVLLLITSSSSSYLFAII